MIILTRSAASHELLMNLTMNENCKGELFFPFFNSDCIVYMLINRKICRYVHNVSIRKEGEQNLH